MKKLGEEIKQSIKDGKGKIEVDIIPFEEFIAELQETGEESKYVDGKFVLGRGGMTFAPETVKQYRKAYDEEVRRIRDEALEVEEFTKTQKQKLENAGLLGASREEQLRFLFGKEKEEGRTP